MHYALLLSNYYTVDIGIRTMVNLETDMNDIQFSKIKVNQRICIRTTLTVFYEKKLVLLKEKQIPRF